MFTTKDTGKGLVKVCWRDVADRVAKVEPKFAQIVNELSPDKHLPLYLAYYPYGAMKGDTQSTFFPTSDGKYFRITDPEVPTALFKDLGYSKNNAPAGMLLNKTIELYLELEDKGITIPWVLYKPGSIFPFSRILKMASNKKHHMPSGLLKATSGVRSTFMLPNIGCVTQHTSIQRDFNTKTPAPKSLYEHWFIFRDIVNSGVIDCDWSACIMYFSEKWIEKIYNDPAWKDLQIYIHSQAWREYEYHRNQIYYSLVFSLIQEKRRLKPNPYLTDTAKQLFAIAIGCTPGFSPAVNEDALPLALLQNTFLHCYGMEKYYATIMEPSYFTENTVNPVYYSLQNPTMLSFSPKARRLSSTLVEMRELEHIMQVFSAEIAKDNLIFAETVINEIAKNVDFQYFHNEYDAHKIVRPTEDILLLDERFTMDNEHYKSIGTRFAKDARFLRGCISVSKKS